MYSPVNYLPSCRLATHKRLISLGRNAHGLNACRIIYGSCGSDCLTSGNEPNIWAKTVCPTKMFCPENVLYFFLCLLHIFKCASDKIVLWKQKL